MCHLAASPTVIKPSRLATVTTAIITAAVQDAKRVGVSCPVQSLCLEWALLAGIDHGVWGRTE